MNRATIYLAALLHDIGKFWQRADANGTISSHVLSASTKQNEGLYCPQFKGRYSHKHVLWTAEFLDRHSTFFKAALDGDAYEAFFKAAVMHHKPERDVFQQIVQKADHYASGVDRTGDWGEKDAEAENAWDSFKNVRMVSIFEALLSDKLEFSHRLPVHSLSLGNEHFPDNEKASEKGQLSYAKVWKAFEDDFLRLKEVNASNAFSVGENMSSLLWRYASAVPSSTMHLPDVSLYDHLKSTAVFAVCLYDYLEENGRLEADFKITNEEAPFLLVGGDLSGIQKYIYDIISKNAARNLKGRSFYLQMLVENAVEEILHALDLPWSAVVYASGGGFYLLAPNTEKTQRELKIIRASLADNLFELHQTNLFLGIEWTEVTQQQIFGQEINEAWKLLTQKISKTKLQKFGNKIKTDYPYFFEAGEIGGKQQRDHVTGEEFTEDEASDINTNRFNKRVYAVDSVLMKADTYQQIEIGKVLRKTDYWITSQHPVPVWEKHQFHFGKSGIWNYLLDESTLKQLGNKNPDGVMIRAFDIRHSGFDPAASYFKGRNCLYGFTFYGGNEYPADQDGELVTFDKMAEAGSGAHKLGILRMDVDNLGSIFVRGLGESRRTFSRYSVLSRSLDYFFKGYLNHIWRDPQFMGTTSIIYSGGDDLFIVGHWNATIEMAKRIHKDFKRWVCDNPHLSISGGIALTGGSFPISKGASFAAEAEKAAKNHETEGLEKNAITLFNVPLHWELELPIVETLKSELLKLIEQEVLPRGILQKLLNYAAVAHDQEEKGKNLSWRWHMAYDFSRAAKRHKEEAKAFYDKIKNAAFTDTWDGKPLPLVEKRTFLDLLEVAARWVELETKK